MRIGYSVGGSMRAGERHRHGHPGGHLAGKESSEFSDGALQRSEVHHGGVFYANLDQAPCGVDMPTPGQQGPAQE